MPFLFQFLLQFQYSFLLSIIIQKFGANMSGQQGGLSQEEHKQEIIEVQGGHEQQQNSQFSQDFQSDEQPAENMIQKMSVQINQNEKCISEVKNPISSYITFVKSWKMDHPDEKLNMKTLKQVWRDLTTSEKMVYQLRFKQEKRKYEEYCTYMQIKDPSFGKKGNGASKNNLFPMHRVKAIMKQDAAFTTSAQNVEAMTKAVQYFGQYLLQQVKKMSEGKKRIDEGELYDSINANQTNLWFLNCLIDQHNQENKSTTKRVSAQPKQNQQKKKINHGTQEKKKLLALHKKAHTLPKGQMRLTDMF